MKYRVTYEYRCVVSCEIEAANEEEAEALGYDETDAYINGNLTLHDVTVRKLTTGAEA